MKQGAAGRQFVSGVYSFNNLEHLGCVGALI